MKGRDDKDMKNIKYILFAMLVAFFVVLPVNAEQETGTAGSSLGKDNETDTSVIGYRAAAGWQKDNTGWWYLYSDGSYPALSWRKIDGQWYYFNSAGYWVDNNNYEEGSMKGIDVSVWQGKIDWQKVKQDGIQFAIIRLGHDDQVLDTRYEENMKGAIEAGIPVGVYFYSTAVNEQQAVADAKYVIENIAGYKISYPVVIDVEDSSQRNLGKAALGRIVKAFCDEIHAAGYTPMWYSNEDWYNNYVDVSQLENVEKWIARYNVLYDRNIPRGIWQCCSTGRVAGINGNVDIDFGFKDYTQSITPRTYPVEGYTSSVGFWLHDSKGWWYRYYDGGYPKKKWERIFGYWYWFDAEGYMTTGWQYVNGGWYYMNESGAMTTGWQYVGGKWYYMDRSGAMTTGWQYVGGKWYYMDKSGAMITGWQYVNGGWYYMNRSGEMTTGWQYVDGKWYYMNKSGTMITGWQYVGSKWYYMNKSGEMTTGWQYVNGGWYYMNRSGEMTTGWQYVNGGWYYMNRSGEMTTGWQYVDGKWYYMNKSGEMDTGWLYKGGAWYYLNADGSMVTGKQLIDNTYYTFRSDGRLQ